MSNLPLKIYCDGGSRGNPGPAAAAFVIIQKGKIIFKNSKYLGKTTNNVAEYSAVLMAHQWLKRNQQKETARVFIYLDSLLVVKQLNQQYKLKNERLKKYFLEIKNLERQTGIKFSYQWVERNKNKVTDYMVNEVLNKRF